MSWSSLSFVPTLSQTFSLLKAKIYKGSPAPCLGKKFSLIWGKMAQVLANLLFQGELISLYFS